jgi:hypothetical protein
MKPNKGFYETERVARVVDNYIAKREREQMDNFDYQKFNIMRMVEKHKKEEKKNNVYFLIAIGLLAIIIILGFCL